MESRHGFAKPPMTTGGHDISWAATRAGGHEENQSFPAIALTHKTIDFPAYFERFA
jgi:hypothetical protein